MSEDRESLGPQAVIEEAREFWQDFAKDTLRGSIAAIEEAAKQVVSINGILIGFYTGAIAFADLRGQVSDYWQLVLYLSPIIFWLLSLMAALGVFWLKSYTVNIQSSLGAKKVVEKMITRKHIQLRISFLFLFAGILLLLIVLSVHLKS